MRSSIHRSAALALAALAWASPALAQVASPFPQDARPRAAFAATLGMGDAVTAVPSMEAAFFTNPALLGRLSLARPSVQVLGVGADLGGSVFDLYSFYRDTLQPAIDDGLGDICETDRARCRRLYDRALALGARPATAGAAAFGPALQMDVAPLVSVQAGVFGHTSARARFFDGGAGVPVVDLYDQTDLVVPVGAAVRVPGAPVPLAVGATASYARRWLTAKYAFVDELNADSEALYVLSGNTVSVDVGVHASDVGGVFGLPGFDVGVAVHRLVGGGFTYAFNRRIALGGDDTAPMNTAEITRLEDRFNEREARPQLRAGVAYRLPAALLAAAGPVRDVSVSADYVGASTSEYHQTFGAKLRVGAQAAVGPLALRAGMAQGYPSLGLGLHVRAARLDYAFFGVEEGRRAGQLRRGVHLLQLRFGLF